MKCPRCNHEIKAHLVKDEFNPEHYEPLCLCTVKEKADRLEHLIALNAPLIIIAGVARVLYKHSQELFENESGKKLEEL